MPKIVVFSLTLLIIGMVLLKLLVLFLEPRLTFFPIRGLRPPDQSSGIHLQEKTVTTQDGESVYIWHLTARRPTSEILFFHGNGGNLSFLVEFLMTLQRQALSVAALDYRGYGNSTGSPTEKGLYLDTQALVEEFWLQIHQSDLPVIYWGRSLGGVMAAYASTLKKPDGLILEASFPSKRSLLKHYPLFRLLGMFSTYRFPTAKFLENLSCPVLVIHGDRDQTVPFREGEKLFRDLPQPKYFYSVAGADHNDTHLVNPIDYWRQIKQFAEEI